MARRVVDTSVLIKHWRATARPLKTSTEGDAQGWADELIRLRNCDGIVTPVYLEFVAGTQDAHELSLARAFLSRFRIIDKGHIADEDWVEARRFAERVPRKPRSRDLGDCLIRAVANRLHHDVDTLDHGFP